VSSTTPGPEAVALPADATGTWNIDPSATTVQLHTKAMWGLAKVTGTLKVTDGAGTVSADGQVSGQLVIDARSIDTGNARRDKHLRSADFFEVDKYPTITYAATNATIRGADQVGLTGTLEVHGVTRPLDMVATITEVTPQRAVITADITGIDRREWGLTWAKMGAQVINRVTVRAVFTKAA
jgi:polyisoprenoid-binding protein YceI